MYDFDAPDGTVKLTRDEEVIFIFPEDFLDYSLLLVMTVRRRSPVAVDDDVSRVWLKIWYLTYRDYGGESLTYINRMLHLDSLEYLF